MTGRAKVVAQGVAVALVASLFVLLAWQLAGGHDERLEVGEPVPSFTLRRLDTTGTLSLESLRGRAVVLNFWASWCRPCEEEADALEETWRKYRSHGLVVVGIDSEDFDSDARKFARENGMTYPLVYDGPGEVKRAYGLEAVPETFVVDRRGRLVAQRIRGPVDADEATATRFERAIERALQQ